MTARARHDTPKHANEIDSAGLARLNPPALMDLTRHREGSLIRYDSDRFAMIRLVCRNRWRLVAAGGRVLHTSSRNEASQQGGHLGPLAAPDGL